MKFSPAQVLAVLEASPTRSLTTAQVKEDCRLAADLDRYGGTPADVRGALEYLYEQGTVVKARWYLDGLTPAGDAPNPYQFIAGGGDGNAWFWMTKVDADAYGEARAQRDEAQAQADSQLAEVCQLLGVDSIHSKVNVEMFTGTVRFRLTGDGAQLDQLLTALRR